MSRFKINNKIVNRMYSICEAPTYRETIQNLIPVLLLYLRHGPKMLQIIEQARFSGGQLAQVYTYGGEDIAFLYELLTAEREETL